MPEQLYCNGKVIFLYNALSPPAKQVVFCFGHLHFSEHEKLQYPQQDKSHKNKTAVIVRSDYDEIHSMEDLKGKHTANTISSTYATLAEKYGAEVKGVDDLNQTIELLLSNRIDATLNTEVTYYDYLKAHPDADIKIAALSDEVEKVAILSLIHI